MEILITLAVYVCITLLVMGVMSYITPKERADHNFGENVLVSISWPVIIVIYLIVGPFMAVDWVVRKLK